MHSPAIPLPNPTKEPLGQALVHRHGLNPAELKQALAQQDQCGSPLGEILASRGHCPPLAIYQALAEQNGKPFADLLSHPPDPACSDESDIEDYHRLQCFPWRISDGKTVLAAARETPELLDWARQRFGYHYVTVLTSPRDIQRSLAARFRDDDTRHATTRLRREQPAATASTLPLARLQLRLAVLLLMVAGVGFWDWKAVLNLLWLTATGIVFGTLGFKLLVSLAGRKAVTPSAPLLSDRELPRYSLLVPMYREAAVIPRLITALRALDYPKAKLQILLILEEDDEESLQAVLAMRPERYFQILRIPPSEPRTKPKAMNLALRYVTGDYLVIYDAEDKPDPDQLRLAASLFAAHAAQSPLCLQGRLNYDNYADNLLTRLFALEYGAWFETMLPGMARLGLPIPLGGTSNHFRVAELEQLLGWDPYNVTEDADLGLRLFSAGGKTLILPSRTMEEAPRQFRTWLKQRSRWVKGYMLTYLVHQRQGRQWLRQNGLKAWLTLQLFIAGPCLLFLASPWLTGYALLDAAGHLPLWLELPAASRHAGYAALLLSMPLHGWQAWAACRILNQRMGWWLFAVFPLYWLGHSLAAYRALWELFRNPFYWAKTEHGTSEGQPQGLMTNSA